MKNFIRRSRRCQPIRSVPTVAPTTDRPCIYKKFSTTLPENKVTGEAGEVRRHRIMLSTRSSLLPDSRTTARDHQFGNAHETDCWSEWPASAPQVPRYMRWRFTHVRRTVRVMDIACSMAWQWLFARSRSSFGHADRLHFSWWYVDLPLMRHRKGVFATTAGCSEAPG
jgi:hypothetical protein